MSRHSIVVIAGDGICNEVMPEGIRVLEAAGSKFGIQFEWKSFPWGCEYYAKNGQMMPVDGLHAIRDHDAIFLGAVGSPGVPDHISLWGLLIPIRREFQQYANVRPVRLLSGVDSPLRNRRAGDVDLVIVRENTEGEYSKNGIRKNVGTDEEFVVQESIFTRKGIDRILRYAFELAASRPRKRLTWATKSNGIYVSMPYWDERAQLMKAQYPNVSVDHHHIDILAAHFVRNPERFDVVVAS